MKAKASITLSADLMKAVDRLAKDGATRSSVIEQAVREFFARRERERRDARDIEIINAHADEYNAFMAEVLEDQVDV